MEPAAAKGSFKTGSLVGCGAGIRGVFEILIAVSGSGTRSGEVISAM